MLADLTEKSSEHLSIGEAGPERHHGLDQAGRPYRPCRAGDRLGTVKDPFGHVWYIATHKEDLSPDEMKQREAAQYPR